MMLFQGKFLFLPCQKLRQTFPTGHCPCISYSFACNASGRACCTFEKRLTASPRLYKQDLLRLESADSPAKEDKRRLALRSNAFYKLHCELSAPISNHSILAYCMRASSTVRNSFFGPFTHDMTLLNALLLLPLTR